MAGGLSRYKNSDGWLVKLAAGLKPNKIFLIGTIIQVKCLTGTTVQPVVKILTNLQKLSNNLVQNLYLVL